MEEIKEDQRRLGTEPEEKKKSKKWLVLLLLLLLCFACGGGYFIWKSKQPKSKYETDLNALAGFLPGRTQEEIEAELGRIIAEGMFNASMNGELTLENKKMDVHIENVPANNYDMLVEVYLYPQAGSTENAELVYKSGIIKRGFYIEEGDASTTVDPGDYVGIAIFHAIMPDETQEEIGQTALSVVIHVK